MKSEAPTPSSPRAFRLFRESSGVLPSTLALAWTSVGWLVSFYLMGTHRVVLNIAGVLLCGHTMVLAAYLLHDAAHQSLLATPSANRRIGEWLSFVAGGAYASFERIRHMHIRHHVDRADVTCFNFKQLIQNHPALRRLLEIAEWACLPATEALMHAQVVLRPFVVPGQRRYLPRVLGMLVLRGMLLALLAAWSLKALILYTLAFALFLHVLDFFDAFHHTFEQRFIAADEAIPKGGSHAYEQANTYSNLLSRWPWLNFLTLNFGYHNAHHERPSVPWYRLPALHRSLYGDGQAPNALPLLRLLRAWHVHRVHRVAGDGYGAAPDERIRADDFVGAHGVSFLTVV
jgi:fatty acid desaturase